MEVEERSNKRKYGRVGCLVAIFLIILIIILFYSGLLNFPEST